MEYLLIYLSIINLISFITFFIDKRKSIKKKWRIRESTLHLLSFTGGIYGSIAAMLLFRHKTKKSKFCIITIVALIINLVISYIIIYI
jgi:uncharacterized membrane protein YsdA (DUF1294 family)